MNILFIHEVDWLNKVVFEIHNLAESLSLLNNRVYAIDYADRWQRNGFFDFGSLRTKEINGVSRAIPGASISLRHPGFIKIPGLSRVSASITHYLEIRRTIKEKDIDVIVLYSVPTNGLQALSLARRYGIPIVFRSIDILYRIVRYHTLRLPTRYLERRVYSNADLILAITPHHAKYVISLGAPESRVRLLPLPIDTSIFRPSVDYSEVQQKWGIGEGQPVVLFIGTLFEFSGLDRFVPVFHRVLESAPEARLLIVGDGPQRTKLDRLISELDLTSKVTITGFQPYQTMPQYINMSTVCINPFLNTEATMDIFPGKIIQYIACGKPTVATPLLGIKTLIPDECGGIIYTDSAEGMAKEVTDLLKSTERGKRLGQAGLDYVRRVHDQQKIAHQLEEELSRTVTSKSGE